jgi:hypothetical protein
MTTRAASAAADLASKTTAELFLAASQEWADEERIVEAKRDTIADALAVKLNDAVREKMLTRGLNSRGLNPCYRLTLALPTPEDDLKALFPYDDELMTKFLTVMGFDESNVRLICKPVYYQGSPVLEVQLERV